MKSSTSTYAEICLNMVRLKVSSARQDEIGTAVYFRTWKQNREAFGRNITLCLQLQFCYECAQSGILPYICCYISVLQRISLRTNSCLKTSHFLWFEQKAAWSFAVESNLSYVADLANYFTDFCSDRMTWRIQEISLFATLMDQYQFYWVSSCSSWYFSCSCQ